MKNFSHFTQQLFCFILALVCLLSFAACQSGSIDNHDQPTIPARPDIMPPITEKPTTPATTPPATEDTQTPEIPNTTTEITPPNTTPILPPEPKPEPKPVIHTLTFVGDCTLGTMPDWESYSGCFNNIVKKDYKWPFANVLQYFENDDCTFVNLESVLANSGKPENKQFTFKGPTDYVNILTQNSVEFANLSNNHSYDFGEAGYASTTETLANNAIAYVGKKGTSLITTNSGLRIGVYGVYFSLDEKDMKADVQFLQDAGADIIIAAVHWGIEREYQPNSEQKRIAHKLIDAGVDIVWGHHPHVLQPIEQYNDGIIYYSLGNFSFGGNHNPSDKDTAVLQQQIIQHPDGTIALGDLVVVPCSVSSVEKKNDFKPTPSAESDKRYERVLSKLGLEDVILPSEASQSNTQDVALPNIENDSMVPLTPSETHSE